MLIMKSADWLRVARPILLVCISLTGWLGVTIKWGTISSFPFPLPFLFHFPSFPFPSPSLHSLTPISFSPLPSFTLSLFIPSNPARDLGSAVNVDVSMLAERHNAARRRQSYFVKSAVGHLAFQVDQSRQSVILSPVSRSHSHLFSLYDWLRRERTLYTIN